jgi:REP element-mobilizing transposase RayT
MSAFHTRRLPHCYSVGEPLFLTWCLYGALPANRRFPAATTSGEAFVAMDRLLDSTRTGPQYLHIPEIASMVVEGLHDHAENLKRYDLHRYVVMSNHVHLLVTPRTDVSQLMQSLKRHTAKEANRYLGLTGHPFWQDESYDRLVRDATEFQRISRYIEMNPVNAGLALSPEDFRWSGGGPIDQRPQVANLPHKERLKSQIAAYLAP